MDKLTGKSFRVSVPLVNIVRGQRFTARNCPIAISVNEKMRKVFGKYFGECVVGGDIRFNVNPPVTVNAFSSFVLEYDEYIRDWMKAFDCKKSVEPIEIELCIGNATKRKTSIGCTHTTYNGWATIVASVDKGD